MDRITLIGVPTQGGGRPFGTARGVGALRAAGVVSSLRERVDVIDQGDVVLARGPALRDPATALIDPDRLSALVRAVDDAVVEAFRTGRFPLVLGGDCPILLGCLRATRRHMRDIGLLHVDAHEDNYTPRESSSGAWSDCEIAFALGSAAFSWDPDLLREQPFLDAARFAILGARDQGELDGRGVASLAERVFLRTADATARAPARVIEEGLEIVGAVPFWLHLDWDVLDSRVMPAVICPIDGGLDWSDLDVVIGRALADPRCVGFSAGTYNPDLDRDGSSAERIVRYLARWLAGRPRSPVAVRPDRSGA